jgi:hypothetical protein
MGKIDLPAVIETAVQNQKIDLNNVNFLLPTQTFGQVLGEYDKLVIEVVQIDPEEDAFEVAKDKYSPGKRPLMAISNALGIIWDPITTSIIESTERRSRAKATGAMRKPNGEWVVITEEKTVDLDVIEEEQKISYEEKAEQGDQTNIQWKKSESGKSYPIFTDWKSEAEKKHWINIMVRRAVLQYRKFKDEWAMTGAKERLIRAFVALKNTYSREELSKPFAFPRVIPDTSKMLSHPEVRKSAIERMTGAVKSVFGPSPSGEKITEEAPKYQIIEISIPNKKEPEERKKDETIPPWDEEETDEAKEAKEIKACLKELEELVKVEYLHPHAKEMVKEELKRDSYNLEVLNALIERIKNWLKRLDVVKKYGAYKKDAAHAKAN